MPIKPRCCNPFCCFSAVGKRSDPTSAAAQTALSESGPFSQAPQGASHDGVDARFNVSGPPRCDDGSSSGSSNVPKTRSEEEDVDVNLNASRAPPCINEASTSGSSNVPNTRSEEEDADVNPNTGSEEEDADVNPDTGSEEEDAEVNPDTGSEEEDADVNPDTGSEEEDAEVNPDTGSEEEDADVNPDTGSEEEDADVNPNVSGAPPCINEAPSSSGATKSSKELISSIREDVDGNVNLDDLMNHIYELLKLREEGKQQQASNLRKSHWPNVPGLQKLKEIVSFGTDFQKLESVLSSALTFGSQLVQLKDFIHGPVKRLLEEIGKASVATAGLLVVAQTLEIYDDVSTNKEKCWDLIKDMIYLANVVKQLKQSPKGMAQFLIQKATLLLVEGAIICCNQIDGSAWQRSFLSSKIKEDLSEIRQKLRSVYLQIDIEIGFRLLTAVEDHGWFHLSKRYPSDAVGINEPIKQVLHDLELESKEKAVTVILHGFGGMGKTTLADAVFAQVAGCRYSHVQLFQDIDSKPDIVKLQKKILKDLMEPEESVPEIRKYQDGQEVLKERLEKIEALIYIDNVLEKDALTKLLPSDMTKAKKVRLLLTARNKDVEKVCPLPCKKPKIYKMEGIKLQEAKLILKKEIEDGINDTELDEIIEKCGNIPLMLTLAARFIGRADNKQEAFSTLMLQKDKWTAHDDFKEMRYKFAYDAIPPECKDPFLDICSYFKGWKWDIVQDIVGEDELRMLDSRALVTNTNGVASVHDVILTLARKSEEESNGKEVRKIFTSARELKKFLEEEDTQEIKEIKGIWLNDYGDGLHISAARLELMHNSLRVLHLKTPTKVEGNCNEIFKKLIYLEANIIQLPFQVSQLKQLRYLSCIFPQAYASLELMNFDGRWQSRAFQVLSTDFRELQNLRVLIFINFTKFKELPKELGKLVSLRVLKLIACESIRKLPEGLDQLKNLKELVLNRCRNVTELCNDFSSQILDLSECDKLEQFPGDGSPFTDISVQAFSISESQKEDIENKVLSEFGETVHPSHLPPNTPVIVICDRHGLLYPRLPNFPTIFKTQKKIEIIYIGQNFHMLHWRIKHKISVIHMAYSRVQKVLEKVCLTLDAAGPPDEDESFSYLQIHTKPAGEKSDNYRPCWRFLTKGELEEFLVGNSKRYLRLKQLAETNQDSNIKMLKRLFPPGLGLFIKKDSSGQVPTCGVKHMKGKTILLVLRTKKLFDDIDLLSLKEMYDEVVKEKLDLEIISIPILPQTDVGRYRNNWFLQRRTQERFSREVPWFVLQYPWKIRKVTKFFLAKQCGWEEGDKCENWCASIYCIIEPNGRVIPFRPFTKYPEAESTPILAFLFNKLEKVSDEVKRIMFQVKWGVEACPTMHEEIENFKKEEWEQLKSMSTLEFLFNHLESTSDQVKSLMRQGKIICLRSGCKYDTCDKLMNEMDQFKKGIHIITVGGIRLKRLLLTGTIYKNCYKIYAIPTEVEKMSSLNLSSHEHMRFSTRLHYLKEEINRIKESDKKLSELKSVLQSFHDQRSMTFMDQYGKVVATLGAKNMRLISGPRRKDRAQRFMKSMMKDIEGGGKEMHDKDPGVSDSLIQNMQTASTSVAVEQKNMDYSFESLLEDISELWGVELYQLLKFNKDGKKSSPSRVTWPASSSFRMLKNFLSEGTDANWIKDVISPHPEEVKCETVIKSLLKDMKEENWGVAVLLGVAFVLERFESVSANQIEQCLLVLDEMLRVAQYINQLNQKPELSWRRIRRVATVSIVICSIACSSLIDPSKFALFELPTVDNGRLGRIQYELELIGNNIANAITQGLDGESGSELEKMCNKFELFIQTSW